MIRYFQIIIWTCISLIAFGQAPFYVSYPASLDAGTLDGRLLLLISTDSTAEPRFQITDEFTSAQVFGQNVDAF